MRAFASDFQQLRQLRAKADRAPVLDVETERDLLERHAGGSKAALQSLIASHMRLVLSIADRHARQGVSMEDLVSEGALGLVEAARRFDPERGTRFGTYAAWWVRAYIRRYALANRRIVPVPSTRNARKVLWALRRTERDLTQRQGRPPSREEIASALGVPPEDVANVQSVLGGRDVTIGPTDEGMTGFDPAVEGPSPEEAAAHQEALDLNRRRILEALEGLSEREREIIRQRLLADSSMSLASLGESLGVSRERVRQIQQRAESKLRTTLLDRVA
jgi:RNA polymerase sigma-32 factor